MRTPTDNKSDVEEKRLQEWFMHQWRHGRGWPSFYSLSTCKTREALQLRLVPATEENDRARHAR